MSEFKCKYCGKEYKTEGWYKKHLKKHEENKVVSVVNQIQESGATKEEKLEAMYDAHRRFNESLQDLDSSRQRVDFDVDSDFIAVVGVSDLHYGNVNVNMDYIERILSFIENHDRVYCFLNGDILDNWVEIAPKGGVYEQTLKPEYQKDIMVHKLNPIKDKILAIVTGNHEGRSQKGGHVNPIKTMAEELGVAYLGAGGRLNLNFGEFLYKLHIRHRFRYESSFNPCHSCGRLIEQLDADADIVAIGHKHEPAVEVRFKAGKQRSFMRFGSALPSTLYADYLGYGETPMVAPTVILSGDKFFHQPLIDINIVKTFIRKKQKL